MNKTKELLEYVSRWYHECNFHTVQEIRDNILNKLEI